MATIKQLREQQGYSQEELARKAMVSYMTVSRLERGIAVSLTSVKRVCAALNVSVEKVEEVTVTNPYQNKRGGSVDGEKAEA